MLCFNRAGPRLRPLRPLLRAPKQEAPKFSAKVYILKKIKNFGDIGKKISFTFFLHF